MADVDLPGQFPNSKMAGAVKLGVSQFISFDVADVVVPPVVYATFNGTAVNGVVVSNGGLTATHTSSTNNAGVSSASFLSTGKYYFEVTVTETTFTGNALGIVLTSGTYADVGSSLNCSVVSMAGAVGSNNTAALKAIGAFTNGSIAGVAIDLTNRLAWFRRNNGNWNGDAAADPATGIGGVTIAAGSFAPCVRFSSATPTNNMTANFGATAFTGTVPSGFTSGWTQ